MAHPESRERLLTAEDLEDIRRTIQECHSCTTFTPEEIQQVRDFVSIYKETRSIVLKAAIGALLILTLTMVVIGVKWGLITLKP